MPSPSTQTCARCGEAITPGARFCMKCGADISGQQGNVATAMMPVAQERDADEALLEQLKAATLGEYEILRELGRGGMATVYLAHDIALDRKVAIKVMSPALLLLGEGMVERFRREARTAASLSHPHIIPIYTVKSTGTSLFFVMKFIAGRSLETIIREVGPLPVPMVKAILHQVGSALGYAHRHGIVHRDVKPANIMLDEEGWAVVTDFGIAKVAENRSLTMTGIAVGTPSYMSPEQCAAKSDITGKSDQYSLGVVAYEMLSGKQPFEGDSAMAIMFAHFHEQPRALTELAIECPADLAAAVMRMLEKSPDKRWRSLEDAMGAMGATPLPHDDPTHLMMQEVARRRSTRELLESIPLPPTSPVPPGRETASAAATTPIPAPRVAVVTIAPARSDLHVGDSMQLTATPRVAGGTAAGGKVSWASSNPAVATVSDSGLVTAVAAGEAAITAACEEVKAAAAVIVTPTPVGAVQVNPSMRALAVGESIRLEVLVRDTRGATLTDRAVEWASADSTIAVVSADGTVTATSEGTAEISASSEGVRGSARISVTPAPAESLTLTPPSLSLSVGTSASVEAVAKDRRGTVLKNRSIEWASTQPGVATVSPAGMVVAQSAGTAEITARCEGVRATAAVTVTPAPVASVAIASPEPILAGDRLQLTVTVKDARGQPLTGRRVQWVSSAPAVAIVSPGGLLTGVSPGTAKISAESEGKSWTVSVTVLPVPVASVSLSGLPDKLVPGGTASLTATLRDGRGNTLADRKVEWRSDNPKVVAVSPQGVLKAKSPGTATVTAAAEGKEASATLTVAAPPPAESPAAEPVPSPARARTGAQVATPALETVAATEAPTEIIRTPALEPARPVPAEPARAPGRRGVIVGALLGLAILGGGYVLFNRGGGDRVEPEAEPVSPSPELPAPGPPQPMPVASVAIANPPPGPVTAGRTLQLAAVLRDAAGAELGSREITWWSSDTTIATVDQLGAVSALQPGTVRISAQSESQSAELSLVIEAVREGPPAPPPVGSVAIAGVAKPLEIGDQLQLVSTVKDARGTALTDRTVVWSSSAPQVVTVTAGGRVSAAAAGTAVITASSEGKSGTVKLTVKPPPAPPPVVVASVTVAPTTPTILVGQTVQLTASVLDDKRNRIERPIIWSSSDPEIARVDAAGLVTAVGRGAASITASVEGRTASARVTVNEPPPVVMPVATVTVTAPTRTIKVGETATWTAVARDRNGNLLTDRPLAWSSSDPKVAGVANGVITGLAAGRAEIRVEVEGKRALERIQVEAAPPPPAPGPAPGPGPVAASALLPRRSIVAGGALSCGIANGVAVCWGGGETGLAGVGGASGVTEVVTGRAHACAIAAGGRALCWGENKAGQLGDGSTPARSEAAPVAGDLSFSALSAGAQHTCGIAGGRAYCWGDNGSGQLGDGSTGDKRRPVAVRLKESAISIAAGGKHSCAVTASGKAYCWGDGFSGQLGVGSLDQHTEPIEVAGNNKWTTVSAGGEHSCGITAATKAFCWGGNRSGQLGDGSTSDRSSPVAVSTSAALTAITAGGAHSCALSGGGDAYCWGDNRAGQLGDGTKSARNKPVSVGGSFSSVSAGGRHTCGLTRGGEPVCWGENDKGQLGDGSVEARGVPAPVKAPR